MNVVGLFSGVGGIELGFEQAGFETRMLCELDDACRTVLAHQFPNVPTQIDVLAMEQLPRTDVEQLAFRVNRSAKLVLRVGFRRAVRSLRQ